MLVVGQSIFNLNRRVVRMAPAVIVVGAGATAFTMSELTGKPAALVLPHKVSGHVVTVESAYLALIGKHAAAHAHLDLGKAKRVKHDRHTIVRGGSTRHLTAAHTHAHARRTDAAATSASRVTRREPADITRTASIAVTSSPATSAPVAPAPTTPAVAAARPAASAVSATPIAVTKGTTRSSAPGRTPPAG